MPQSQSSHYSLNSKQLHYLKLLYKFRYATTKQLSLYRNKTQSTSTHLALRNLLEQNYIARYYDNSYKLHGRAASYYLTKLGIGALKQNEYGELSVFKTIYKDATASEQKINHYLSLVTICNQLKAAYPEKLTYFSKSELAPEAYSYFPHPLPDAYIQLKTGDGEQEFFLQYIEASRPIFTAIAKIKQFIDYIDATNDSEDDTEDVWPAGQTVPAIRVVCETSTLEKQLYKRIRRLSRPLDLDLRTTTLERLDGTGISNAGLWYSIEEPLETVSFEAIIETS